MNKTETANPNQTMTSNYEAERIDAFNRYRIEDTLPEEIFDHYVEMATLIFRIPAAIIAFVGKDAIYYKASIGIGESENITRLKMPCAETIGTKKDVHVVNLAKVNQSSANSNNGHSNYTYYVGTPIFTFDGHAIGCLSLLDNRNHKLKQEQLMVLKILASAIMDAVEYRLSVIQEKERNNWFLKTTQEGMWEWDIRNDRIWWNNSFRVLFGYDFINETNYDLNFWSSRFVNVSEQEIKSAMLISGLDGEYLFKKADDTEVHVLIKSVMVKNDLGEPVKIIGSIMDISERFENEETNKNAYKDLMRNTDEFISVASHEIKTPISIIKSYSQIIRKEAERDIFKRASFSIYADRIQKQNEKLLTLVENLLDISRINNGKMDIYPESFDFAKLLDQTLDELDMKTESHFIEKTGDSPLIVYADKFRIGQVLTNLISNAIKYSPGAHKIIIQYFKNVKSNIATISIRDFGVGIAQEDQVKLFQKFYRITPSHLAHINGTGLGLNIAMEIVKQHGGTITVDSEPGRGSVFSFDLKLSPAFKSD